MSKRGEELRRHILVVAKEVFLELGFERASMDEIASRAHASKRSVYAHFESKENLFREVIELVRDYLIDRIRVPGAYSTRPAEAIAQFCARYDEVLRYEKHVQMFRLTLSEAARFPDAAARHHDVMFETFATRLGAYLQATLGLSARASAEATERLMAQLLFPLLPRVLFGVEPVLPELDARPQAVADAELRRIQKLVTAWLGTLPKPRARS